MSQSTRILELLRRNKVRGVTNWRLATLPCLDYTARISELRQEGYSIYAERQKLPNGRASNTWKYFLIEDDNKDGLEYEGVN